MSPTPTETPTYAACALDAADSLIAQYPTAADSRETLRRLLAAAWLEGSMAGSAETRDLFTGPLADAAREYSVKA